MQHLHADLAAVIVHGLGNDPMAFGLGFVVENLPAAHDDTVFVRCETTGHDEADATLGARAVERRHAVVRAGDVFEAGVHRPHQHTVFQCGEAKVKRGEQVWVRAGHGFSWKLVVGSVSSRAEASLHQSIQSCS